MLDKALSGIYIQSAGLLFCILAKLYSNYLPKEGVTREKGVVRVRYSLIAVRVCAYGSTDY